MTVKYPHIHVQLSGEDGNGFFIISRAAMAMRKAGVPADDIAAYRSEAMSGDYSHLLSTTMKTVTVA